MAKLSGGSWRKLGVKCLKSLEAEMRRRRGSTVAKLLIMLAEIGGRKHPYI